MSRKLPFLNHVEKIFYVFFCFWKLPPLSLLISFLLLAVILTRCFSTFLFFKFKTTHQEMVMMKYQTHKIKLCGSKTERDCWKCCFSLLSFYFLTLPFASHYLLYLHISMYMQCALITGNILHLIVKADGCEHTQPVCCEIYQ